MNRLLPKQFGKYLLLQKIAVGGMAELFKAKASGEEGFQKLLAIKTILPHLSQDRDLVSMFIEEAKLAALLSHQNIVQIYDFGNEEGSYYIAMEYLQGKDLRAILRRAEEKQGLPIEYALHIASRICAGLEYSHNLKDFKGRPLNIIHRDISPQNILVSYLGDVKIVDFGIAKVAGQSTQTRVGVLKGKISYMSPEQAAGKVIDKRSDIFSTGILLYEMLTGTRMFEGETMEVLERVRNAAFKPPELAAPGLPAEIYEVLRKALAKDPEERFQSCAEMLARLDHCLMDLRARQTAESLSRYVQDLFAEDIAGEVAVEEKTPVLKSFPLPRGVVEQEPTRTVVTDAAQAESAKAAGPVKKQPGGGWVWAVGCALVLLVVASVVISRYGGTAKMLRVGKLDRALHAYQGREFAKALPLFAEAAAEQPEAMQRMAGPYAQSLLHEGIGLLESNPEKAGELLHKCVLIDPTNVAGHFELAKLLTKLKDYPGAIACYEKAAALDYKSPDIFFNLGFLYAQEQDYSRGEEMFLKAIHLSPPYLDEAYFNLAMVQKRQGKTTESIKSLEQTVAINPDNTRAREYLDRFKNEP